MSLSNSRQEELMRQVMVLAGETAAAGNQPFAALLVNEFGDVMISAKNTVNTSKNAAAHAEINLLFEASEKLGTNDLSAYSIVSNAASCPMCATALIKAKIIEFYYGAPNEPGMVPNITLQEVADNTPFPLQLNGGILADQCQEQIQKLANRQ